MWGQWKSMHPSALHMSATTVFLGLQRSDWMLHVHSGIPQPGISLENGHLILEHCSVTLSYGELGLHHDDHSKWGYAVWRVKSGHWLHFQALKNHIIHMCRWWGCTRWAEKAECVRGLLHLQCGLCGRSHRVHSVRLTAHSCPLQQFHTQQLHEK